MSHETMVTRETPAADIVVCLERIDADWQGEGVGTIAVGDLRVWQEGSKRIGTAPMGEWMWRVYGHSVGGQLDSLEELETLVAVHA